MIFLKIYIGLSCLVGLVQVCSGFVLGSGMPVSPQLERLFNFYGFLGPFGGLELLWLGLSTVAAVLCVKQSISLIPPVCFIAFCLLHPLVAFLVPAAAFASDPAAATSKFIPSMLEIVFGLAFVMLNIICYRGMFFVPRLFEK